MPEERLARLEERVDQVQRLVEAFGPTVTLSATMQVTLDHIEEDIRAIKMDIHEQRLAIEERDEAAMKERKDTKVALWSLVGVLGAAIISAIGGVVIALIS